MSRAGSLAALQVVDDRLDALRSEVRAITGLLEGEPELDRAIDALGEAQAAQAAADAEVAAIELTAAEPRRRAAQTQRRLYDGSVGNPAELLTMQHQVDQLRDELATLEEQELAAMERAEAAATATHDAAAALAAVEERRDVEAAPRRHQLDAVRRDIEATTGERAVMATGLPPADLALYTRLASRLRPVVAPLRGDSCGGCRLPMAHQQARAVRSGEAVVQCSNCDRILAP